MKVIEATIAAEFGKKTFDVRECQVVKINPPNIVWPDVSEYDQWIMVVNHIWDHGETFWIVEGNESSLGYHRRGCQSILIDWQPLQRVKFIEQTSHV